MADVVLLGEKIKRLKKSISEISNKEGEASDLCGQRTSRKQLKRLQRRRRVLIAWSQRTKKVVPNQETKPAEAVKETKPAEAVKEAAPEEGRPEKTSPEETKSEPPAA